MRTESSRAVNEPFDATTAFRQRLELAFDEIRRAVGDSSKEVSMFIRTCSGGEGLTPGNFLSITVQDSDVEIERPRGSP